MDRTNIEMLMHLGVALAIGLMIGLERGWEQRQLQEGERVAGFRTFGLVALLGALTMMLSPRAQWLPAATMVALAVVAGIGYYRISRRTGRRGATGVIALFLTFALGAMAGSGHLEASASVAVIVTLLLGFKPELHGVVRRIDRQELLGTMRLLLISVVVLPVLPNRGFGPWQALNPYKLWWMVVLVAGVSYVGYFAQRIGGSRRGTLATALFGGMISSTAVTLTLSRRAAVDHRHDDVLAAAIVVASSLMFVRLLAIVAPVAPMLVAPLAVPLGVAAVVGFAVAGMMAWRMRQRSPAGDHEMKHRNPLDLSMALKFGLLLAAILVLSRALRAWLGDQGVYLIAAAGGVADVDAIALSIAAMAEQGAVAVSAAVAGMLIAVTVNTLVKSAIALGFGGFWFGLRVGLPMVVALVCGAATLIVLR
jgi:uncharacterized membrane protein (DUF4010 family)